MALAICAYSMCSSTLLLANKFAIYYLPLPSVVSFVQIIFSAAAIVVMKAAGVKVDALEKEKVKAYGMYIFAFVSSIYANMKALSNSNVETVIVFRACSPIAVSIIEYLFMGRELPNARSALALVTVAFGAVIYCLSDSEFALKGLGAYTWAIIYFFLTTASNIFTCTRRKPSHHEAPFYLGVRLPLSPDMSGSSASNVSCLAVSLFGAC